MGSPRAPDPAIAHLASILAAAVLAVLAVGLGACGPSGDDRGSPAGPITVQVFGDAIELEGYRDVASAYERATGHSVRLVGLADRDSHLAKLTTSFSAGRPPDAFLLSYRNFGPFVGRSVLEPVAGGADGVPEPYPVVRAAFTRAGRLQCRPINASPLVVYVNRDLFRAAGVSMPAGTWTFDQFFRTALELRGHTRRAGEDATHALGIDPIVSRLAAIVWISGGEIVDRERDPQRFAFEGAATRRGIERFLSLYREALTPTENAVEAEPLATRFAAGHLAMFVSTRREVATFRAARDLSWDVVAFPVAEERATALEADALCVARGPRAGRAAAFAAFAAGADGQRRLARTGRLMPVSRAVAESPAFLQPGRPPSGARVFTDAMAFARALPNGENWPRIEDSASLAFKRAFYAELAVQDAIDRVRAETQGLF